MMRPRRNMTPSGGSDSYVVRVYHRSRTGTAPAGLVEDIRGLVEDIRDGERHTFHTMAELWALLGFPAAEAAGPAASRKPRRRNPS